MTQRDLFYEEPDLATYDLILVNSSGGKDSAASLAYTVQRAEEAGVRNRLVVVHADLGAVEWPGTAELAEEHARHYSLRFEKVRRDGKSLLASLLTNEAWRATVLWFGWWRLRII